jgi:MFS transporter, MHS family, proline/betaine transporter
LIERPPAGEHPNTLLGAIGTHIQSQNRCAASSKGGSSMSVNHSTPKPLQVAAAVIGNALEWYDFIIFGFLTVVIARLFFPAESQYASLLLTTATFGVGFFMRPVGGILLGLYADHKGRKAALLLIIVLMTAAIAMIGFAPTYAAIGVAAPLIMVLARLLQGFATGGEFASATSFLIESAPAHRRGFYGSWQMVGQGLAVLISALLGALITRNLTAEALDSWGWRVPFLLGLVIGPVGLFIRRHLQETEAFLEARGAATVKQSFGTMLATHLKEVLVCMGIITSGTISFYVILLYMPTFARTQLHLPLDQAFVAQSISLACMIALTPLSGALSDRIGRKPIIIAALTLYFVLVYPLFNWVHDNPSFGSLVTMQIILCCLLGVFVGPFSTALAEQFATRARSTGLGIAYNLAVMIFGGFAQFFVTWLIEATGSPIAPSFYVMFGAAIGVVAAFFLVDRAQDVRLPRLETVPSLGPQKLPT